MSNGSTVRLGDVELFYRDAGEGTPLVFVHGGFASLASTFAEPDPWPWEPDFACEHRLLTYHRRGWGRSSCPEDGYDLETQARDLEGLLDHVGIESTHVLASSAGGPIAVVFAAMCADRVRSLCFAATGPALIFADEPAAGTLGAQLELLERLGYDVAWQHRPDGHDASFEGLWRTREAEARGTLRELRAEEAWLARRASETPAKTRARYHRAELRNLAAYERDVTALAQTIEAPALVLHGDEDRVVPVALGEALARALPNAELLIVRGGFHGVFWDEPSVREAALTFFRAAA